MKLFTPSELLYLGEQTDRDMKCSEDGQLMPIRPNAKRNKIFREIYSPNRLQKRSPLLRGYETYEKLMQDLDSPLRADKPLRRNAHVYEAYSSVDEKIKANRAEFLS
jgi:hypothetical protein